ncbi:FAD/NAD(P)-binding domain-containing protein [Apiospora aurea]|uniref:FAD/NAD(P)-binding domain-containing protein n=1 Tax=Apiospora aurea TaxID=335848 RepID=A0ABR1Q274_9PEZI
MGISIEKKTPTELDYDVIAVGAGISGINCAYRLQTETPDAKIAVFEARGDVGGTWDLFKYPGVRSDSDLFTYGFAWEPWPSSTPIAEGHLIVSYMKDCIHKYGLGKYLHFRHKVLSLDWSSKTQSWTVEMEHEGQTKRLTARFVVLGSGYYDYHEPLKAEVPGLENFQGKVIHPQFWPEDYDYADKNMVVIGSGATAITLIPNLAKKARHVTMLQRSPSYVVSIPNVGRPKTWAETLLPRHAAAVWQRWWFMTFQWFMVLMCRHFPNFATKEFTKLVVKSLPEGFSHDPHFKPSYVPWQQRVCLTPDGDLQKALGGPKPKCEVITATIRTVTERGIELEGLRGRSAPNGGNNSAKDGGGAANPDQTTTTTTLDDVDVIVTATGLRMDFMGGIPVRVDGGAPIDWSTRRCWHSAMLSDVPNLFFMIGYVDNSWTPGADATAWILTRVYRHMQASKVTSATPRVGARDAARMQDRRFWNLTSNYREAADSRLPRYGDVAPWKPREAPPRDLVYAMWGDVTKGLHFGVA